VKVIFTAAAVEDLSDIADYLAAHYPNANPFVERRLHVVLARIARHPESAQWVAERPEVRMAPLVRYPYKIFYRITPEAVEILHIHHAARRAPWE